MAIIDSIKDKLNNIIYPRTVTKAVYDETTNERLDNTLLTNKTDILSLETTVGDIAMTTSAQTVKGAINELDADIGNKSTLITTDKTNLVNAVNENREQINDLAPYVITTGNEYPAEPKANQVFYKII